MSAPDRIWAWSDDFDQWSGAGATDNPKLAIWEAAYLREDGPTITAYREALRLLGVDPDSIAREAEKEAQNG